MIFITVGTQLPFDRLICKLDDFFKDSNEDVFAQIGPSEKSPKNIDYTDFVKPSDIDNLYENSCLVIAHAGMGSILTALKYKKPILIIPRKASLGEHRNEHQLATANWVKDLSGVFVAMDEIEMIDILKEKDKLLSGVKINPNAEEQLISFIKSFINDK